MNENVLKKIKHSLRRKWDFKFLTRNVGKGNKNSLRKLHVDEEENKSSTVF